MGAVKSGGQGSVYKGKRLAEQFTAIKILPTPIFFEDESDQHFKDFQNEVEKLKKVNEESCPHIVKILSSGITDSGSFPFIEMEYVEGVGLDEMLKPANPVFTIAEIVKVAEQVASALAHCHSVNVKHGDVKSNNIRFNRSTGNYILLDFGMAIMSDEQRRTSMRYAGAIEFMAPEQNEGMMFFQTDIYSFGIVIFELLAGQVPFLLRDKSETARNKVMLSHIEGQIPDPIALRLKNLPASWSELKKADEMKVPEWILAMLSTCLEKNPLDRFKNGAEVLDFIINKRVETTEVNTRSIAKLSLLKSENDRLKSLLTDYQERIRISEERLALASTIKVEQPSGEIDSEEHLYFPEEKPGLLRRLSMPLACFTIIGIAVFLFFNNPFVKSQGAGFKNTSTAKSSDSTAMFVKFKVKSSKAYFHTNPDVKSKRRSYMISSERVHLALKDSNDFIYTEYQNQANRRSKGWLRKKDLEILGKSGEQQEGSNDSSLRARENERTMVSR